MLPLKANESSAKQAAAVLVVFGFCCVLSVRTVQAVSPSPAFRNLFDVLPVEGDWQQSAVTAIVQSQEGYLWLGTYHGLIRFDGVLFTVFDAGNTRNLPNGLITSLFEAQDGTLWIGHETGHVTRFINGAFQTVSLPATAPGGAVEAMGTDEENDLWLLNDIGILFRARDGKRIETPAPLGASPDVSLTSAKNGKLWIVANGAVAKLQGGKLLPVPFDPESKGVFFERVCPARDGGLWVLGNKRLRKWLADRWGAELQGVPTSPGAVSVLREMNSGAVLAGTLHDGLYLLSTDAAALHFSRTNGLSHDWVRAICQDHEEEIWLGTGAGFDALRTRKVQMLNAPDNWQGCAVLSFAPRADGSAWVGTEGAGLYLYAQQEWRIFSQSAGISNPYIWSILETKRNELFVGTWGGGLQLKTNSHFESPGGLASLTAPVVSLYEGREGSIWIGTTSGLYRYENGELVHVAGKDKLTLPDVRAITETTDGTLWFGMSGGGLGSLKNGTLRQFRKADGLGSDFVVCLYADADGTLWLGTSDNGLTRLSQGKFANISTGQSLPSSILTHIVDDGIGNLWIGSHAGILRASKTELNRCADGLVSSLSWLSYGRAEGMTSPMCSGGFQPGASRTSDGRIWFPTTRGLAIINPTDVTTNTMPPPVVIEEMAVDGATFQVLDSTPPHVRGAPLSQLPAYFRTAGPAGNAAPLQIPPGRQRFEFHYAGLSYIAPEKVRFKYKLEGLEQGWNDANTKRVAQYSYLPPGSYRFRVIACNNDGVWNANGATLAFTVLPFFWQTWWFQLCSLSSGAGAVGAGVFWLSRIRVKQRLDQVERQRALERERARIARDIHDDLGASLTRITLLSQSVRSEVEGKVEVAADVDQIYSTARELTRAMDEIVWAVNPKHDTLDSLVTYLGRFAQQFLTPAEIRCRLDVPLSLPSWTLTSEIRHNTFLALKEALNNVVKHAAATEVRICLAVENEGFVLLVIDDGHGFDSSLALTSANSARAGSGNGLINMQKRMEEIGGMCDWSTAPGEGTRVKFSVGVRC